MMMVTSRGIPASKLAHVAPLVRRQTGEGLVEEEQLRLLRQRHGDLDAPPLAVGGLGQPALGNIGEADAGERRLGALAQMLLPLQIDERVPAQRRQPEQCEHDVAQERVAREQRDDLIGAGDADMGALPARDPRDVASEDVDRAGARLQVAGDLVEQRRLAGAVRADDQAPLAGLDRQVDVARHLQPAERLAQILEGERGHRPASVGAPSAGLALPARAAR